MPRRARFRAVCKRHQRRRNCRAASAATSSQIRGHGVDQATAPAGDMFPRSRPGRQLERHVTSGTAHPGKLTKVAPHERPRDVLQTDVRKDQVELSRAQAPQVARLVKQEAHAGPVPGDVSRAFEHRGGDVHAGDTISVTRPHTRQPPNAATEIQHMMETLRGPSVTAQKRLVSLNVGLAGRKKFVQGPSAATPLRQADHCPKWVFSAQNVPDRLQFGHVGRDRRQVVHIRSGSGRG